MPPSPNMGGMHMTTTTCSWRPYRVALRTQECRGVISLYLEPTDGALPPAFAAGQYVELRMPGIEPHAFFLVGSRAFTEALRTDLVKLGIIHSRVHTQVL